MTDMTKVKVYGAKAHWCQAPRIIEGFWGIGHIPVVDDNYDFIYANNPPFNRGDEEFEVAPLDLDGFKIFNVLDIPEEDSNFDLDKLCFQLDQADVVTCISPVTQEQVKRLTGKEAKVIWNPIKDIYVDGVNKQKTRNFLYVGRANAYNKRFNLLEETNSIEPITVVGNEQPRFGNWHRFLSDVELNFFYNTHRILLFPSSFEGLGLPALEAMAAGSIPLVCSDNPNAGLCPSFCIAEPDQKSIRDKAVDLLENYDYYRSQILEQYTYRIQRKFSKFQIARNILEVYREANKIKI